MSRLPLAEARIVRLAEDSLDVIGGRKEFITKELRLLHFLGGLREARKLSLASAQGRFEQARARMREAQVDLEEEERRDKQCSEIEERVIRDFQLEEKEVDQLARTISIDARAAGFRHTRSELTECSQAEKERV